MNEPGIGLQDHSFDQLPPQTLYLTARVIWAGVIFALSHRQTIPTAGLQLRWFPRSDISPRTRSSVRLLFGGFLFMGFPAFQRRDLRDRYRDHLWPAR